MSRDGRNTNCRFGINIQTGVSPDSSRHSVVRGPPRKPTQTGESLRQPIPTARPCLTWRHRTCHLDRQSPTPSRPHAACAPCLQGSQRTGVTVPNIEEQLRFRELQRRTDLHSRPAENPRLQVPVCSTRQPIAQERRRGSNRHYGADRTSCDNIVSPIYPSPYHSPCTCPDGGRCEFSTPCRIW